MTQWTDESKKHLEEYLGRVAALCRQAGDDPEEVVSGLREHIEAEVEKECGTSLVTQSELRRILAATGSPEEIVGVEGEEGDGDMAAVDASPEAPMPPPPPVTAQGEVRIKTHGGCAFFLILMIMAGFAVPAGLVVWEMNNDAQNNYIRVMADLENRVESLSFAPLSEDPFIFPTVEHKRMEEQLKAIAATRKAWSAFSANGYVIANEFSDLHESLNGWERSLKAYQEALEPKDDLVIAAQSFLDNAKDVSVLWFSIIKSLNKEKTLGMDEINAHFKPVVRLINMDRLVGHIEALSRYTSGDSLSRLQGLVGDYLSGLEAIAASQDIPANNFIVATKESGDKYLKLLNVEQERRHEIMGMRDKVFEMEHRTQERLHVLEEKIRAGERDQLMFQMHRGRLMALIGVPLSALVVFVCSILLIFTRRLDRRSKGAVSGA